MNELTHFPSIKTEISDFCQEFANLLAPFEESLQSSLKTIQGKADSDALQRPIAGLNDVHHRVESLLSKVREQQAYVIIFGPLKSGKSTLMNAISATYVSEVTSLPAYPCLVNVKHGDDTNFLITRYNGQKVPCGDNTSLQQQVRDSHKELAERLRDVEEAGEEFDPGVHFPEAIRRIDVAVPARNLKDSLTVLVDTPGLYTRMKFGYDLMTREFRNSAACAVFVVKTDNLFLEQVFDEFNDLLDLFSRIFLVVNIDTNKRDLGPDGSLSPSLESESPDEIIKAFESLVMSAPLRKAAEEGRLRIYPIDLLNSAAASLKQTNGTEEPVAEAAAGEDTEEKDGEAGEETEETPAGDLESAAVDTTVEGLEPAARSLGSTGHPVESFSVFLKDLTDYLNSNDYLHEFMGDRLHLGKTLAAEIQSHCSIAAVESFRERQSTLRRELNEAGDRLAAVEKLVSLDWAKACESIRKSASRAAEAQGGKLREETEKKALNRLDDWFESDESLAVLQKDWNSLFEQRRREIETEAANRAKSLVANPLGGIELSDDLRRSVDRLELILEPAVKSAREALEKAPVKIPDCSLRIPLESIKLKKGFWDWILFRSQAAMRKQLFGGDDSLDQEVPAAMKRRRLDEEGKTELRVQLTAHLDSLFPSAAVRASEGLLSVYVDTLSKELSQKLQSGKSEYAKKKADLEKRLEENRRIQEQLDALSKQSGEVIESIYSLKEKFSAVSWVARDEGGEGETEDGVPEDADEYPEAGDEPDAEDLSDLTELDGESPETKRD